jgi:hypothetical protein
VPPIAGNRYRLSADIGQRPRWNVPMSAMQQITVILELADLVKAWADAFSRSRRNLRPADMASKTLKSAESKSRCRPMKPSCHKRRIVGSKLAGVLQHFVVWRPRLSSLAPQQRSSQIVCPQGLSAYRCCAADHLNVRRHFPPAFSRSWRS